MPHAVEATSLYATYRTATYRAGTHEVTVLDDVSFTIERGVFTALTGPSGSGKTTLLSLIGGLDVATRGRLVVAGEDLTQLGRKDLSRFRRAKIGFVFQGFHLLPTLTVAENIHAALDPLGVGRKAARARAADALDRVGLLGAAQRFPHELSGGEQQRVAVARACVKNPPLLLADEPTGNLDEEAGALVMELIQSAAHEGAEPRTVIVVTHDARVAARADATLTLHGRSVAPGS